MDNLRDWLKRESPALCTAVLHRAPNMLPDERDIQHFLTMLAGCIGETRHRKLAEAQEWALRSVGHDALAASDWLTILRVLKEEIGNLLKTQFDHESSWDYWWEVENVITNALVETAHLTGGDDRQAQLLEHTVELREKMESLEQSKSNFITVAAHELRTPLTILEGYAKMLRLETDDDSRLRLYVNGLENGILRFQEVIADMIDISLLDLESVALNYQRVNLEKVVLLVADKLDRFFAQRQVDLVIMPFAGETRTFADPSLLEKAFNKVMANALKYTPDNGRVTITASFLDSGNPKADIAGYMDVQVADTGIGIDPVNLEAIFTRFANVSDASLHSSGKTKFKGGGAGLGLPIT
ncbi:MAG: sensor histidine kinase, partial [Anaerolineae bacterium]